MFDLVFEHSDFIVINKHPNVSVHKDEQSDPFITHIEKELVIDKLYLVHRLDKMTSGLLLLAKHSTAAAKLSNLFAQRKVSKFYLAISDKKPKKKQGTLCGDMQKSRRSAWKLLKSKSNPATTQFFSHSLGNGRRLFLCKPYTGKTHQIRVALKSIGAPIVGDAIYYPTSIADRGYLHAYYLAFEYDDNLFELRCSPLDSVGELWTLPNIEPTLQRWRLPHQLPWPKLPQS